MTRTPSDAFVAPCGPDRARFEAARAMAAAVRHRVAVALGLAALVAGGLATGSGAAGAAAAGPGDVAGFAAPSARASMVAPAPDVAAGAPARRLPAADATFPVPLPFPASVSDGWHACRDGCRRQHKGNDIFAPEGAPAVAVESGVIAKVDQTDDGLGGLTVWLRGDSGVTYYYAHNSANLVRVGERVARGQPVARVGHTGNARTTPAHIHFQLNLCGRLDSDEPCTVDPYPFLRAWQQRTPAPGPDGVGVARRGPGDALTVDRLDEGGAPLAPVTLGGVPAGAVPVTGDWDGDGLDTVGLYNPASGNLDPRGPDGTRGAPLVAVGPVGPAWCRWRATGTATAATRSPWSTPAWRPCARRARRALGPILGVADPRPGVPLPPPPEPSAAPPGAAAARPGRRGRRRPGRRPAPGSTSSPGTGTATVTTPSPSSTPPPPGSRRRRRDAPEPVAALPVAGLAAVAGDWDGDGHDSLGLFDPATGTFHVGLGVRQVPAPPVAPPSPAAGRPAAGAPPAIGCRRGRSGATRPATCRCRPTPRRRRRWPCWPGPPASGRTSSPRPARPGPCRSSPTGPHPTSRCPSPGRSWPGPRAPRRRPPPRGSRPHWPIRPPAPGPPRRRPTPARPARPEPLGRPGREAPATAPTTDAGPAGDRPDRPARPAAHGAAHRPDGPADRADGAAHRPHGPADRADGAAHRAHGAHRADGAADRPHDGPDVPHHHDGHDRAAGDGVDDVHHGDRPVTRPGRQPIVPKSVGNRTTRRGD